MGWNVIAAFTATLELSSYYSHSARLTCTQPMTKHCVVGFQLASHAAGSGPVSSHEPDIYLMGLYYYTYKVTSFQT